MQMIHMMMQINQSIFHVPCNLCTWGTYLFQCPFPFKKLSSSTPVEKKTYCCMEHYHIWVFPKIVDLPKMDGENNGTPYLKWDDLGGSVPTIWGNTHIGGHESEPWIHSEEKSSIRFFFIKGNPAFLNLQGSSTGRCGVNLAGPKI